MAKPRKRIEISILALRGDQTVNIRHRRLCRSNKLISCLTWLAIEVTSEKNCGRGPEITCLTCHDVINVAEYESTGFIA